jgi:hypothetical protein
MPFSLNKQFTDREKLKYNLERVRIESILKELSEKLESESFFGEEKNSNQEASGNAETHSPPPKKR